MLRQGAVRARSRPSFVAYAFSLYQDAESLSDKELAEFLGCSAEALSRLALCQRPSGATAEYRRLVELIASFAAANPDHLSQVLRSADAAIRLRKVQADATWDDASLRIAARRPGDTRRPPSRRKRRDGH